MASPQCCTNPPTLNPASGDGKVVDSFGGIKAYVSGAAESKAAVVLVSDIFGFESPNLRKIADKVATSGYFVVVPDFLHGDPFVRENTERPIEVWIKDHGADKGFEEAKLVIAALKEKGVSSIGAAGYCWGAKVVVELAKAHEIHAAVMCHPSLVTVDDIKEVKCPIAILGAEIDRMSPPEVVKQFEQVLSSKSEGWLKAEEHGWLQRATKDQATMGGGRPTGGEEPRRAAMGDRRGAATGGATEEPRRATVTVAMGGRVPRRRADGRQWGPRPATGGRP